MGVSEADIINELKRAGRDACMSISESTRVPISGQHMWVIS